MTNQPCTHPTVIEDKPPWKGWQPGELSKRCETCWHWLDSDNKAPMLGED